MRINEQRGRKVNKIVIFIVKPQLGNHAATVGNGGARKHNRKRRKNNKQMMIIIITYTVLYLLLCGVCWLWCSPTVWTFSPNRLNSFIHCIPNNAFHFNPKCYPTRIRLLLPWSWDHAQSEGLLITLWCCFFPFCHHHHNHTTHSQIYHIKLL